MFREERRYARVSSEGKRWQRRKSASFLCSGFADKAVFSFFHHDFFFGTPFFLAFFFVAFFFVAFFLAAFFFYAFFLRFEGPFAARSASRSNAASNFISLGSMPFRREAFVSPSVT